MAEHHNWAYPPRKTAPETAPQKDHTNALGLIEALDKIVDNPETTRELRQPLRDERARHVREIGMTLDAARVAYRKRGRR